MHKRDCLKNLSRNVLYFRRYKGHSQKNKGHILNNNRYFPEDTKDIPPKNKGHILNNNRHFPENKGYILKNNGRFPINKPEVLMEKGFGQVICVFIRQPSQKCRAMAEEVGIIPNRSIITV